MVLKGVYGHAVSLAVQGVIISSETPEPSVLFLKCVYCLVLAQTGVMVTNDSPLSFLPHVSTAGSLWGSCHSGKTVTFLLLRNSL